MTINFFVQAPLASPRILSSESSDDWLSQFQFPESFSSRTMDAIESGILSQSARTEIVQTLATLIWVHTQRPSKNAYQTICAGLIRKFSSLADEADDDTPPYVSIILVACSNKCHGEEVRWWREIVAW